MEKIPRLKECKEEKPAEVKRLSTRQSKHSQWLMIGVWALVIVFVITSGFMIVGIGRGRGSRGNGQPEPTATATKSEAEMEIERYVEMVNKEPQNVNAQATLGYWYQQAQRYPDAVTHLKKALEIDPNYSFALIHLSETYIFMNQPKVARDYLQKAMKLEPKDASIYRAMALSYSTEKNTVEAVKWARKAIDVDPGKYEHYLVLASMYM